MRIGITGSIGTGKSTVSNYLEKLGYKVVYCDKLTRNLCEINEPCYFDIVNHFGKEILQSDSSIDRRKLRQIIFNDQEEKQKLEAIIHPKVIEYVKNMNTDGFLTFVEVPLLYETHMENLFQKIICVATSEETQLNRIIKRDKTSKEQALKIINTQQSQDEKIKKADYCVYNEDLEDTYKQVDKILLSLKNN